MTQKNFTHYAATSKAVTFSTDAINIKNDHSLAIALTTTAASTLNVSVQLEVSVDGTNWTASGSPIVITTDTTSFFTVSNSPYAYARLTSTRTGGSATFEAKAQTKG